jgi:hypothetical protein
VVTKHFISQKKEMFDSFQDDVCGGLLKTENHSRYRLPRPGVGSRRKVKKRPVTPRFAADLVHYRRPSRPVTHRPGACPWLNLGFFAGKKPGTSCCRALSGIVSKTVHFLRVELPEK